VPIFIKRVGSESGTVVLSSLEKGDGNRAFGRSCAITAIASIDKVALIRVEGSALIGSSTITARLFSRLSQRGINVILITQAPSEYNVCIAVSGNLAKEAKSYINEEFQWEIQCKALSEAILEEDFAIISIVGEAMRHTPGVAARFFSSLARNGVNIATIAQGSSELNVSVVIRGADEIKALSSVHDEFFGAATSRSINVAIAGVGLIGKTLLKQLRANMPRLATSLHLEVKLIGIATSKGYVFNQEGIPGDEWDIVSADSGFKNEGVEKFVDDVIAANLPATIFIDCTASNEVSDEYAKLLSHHINVVTPNKRAQSGPYQKLRKIRESNRASWLYETSVGAGLPIISTLRDLLNSGDSILTIEAILSGTLGFVCSTCMEGEPFSKVVYRAKELGFTEPDPRDDLNGMDVARKLLILARECGSSLELTDVFVESLVPKELVDIQDTSVFLSRLPQYDESFTKRVREVEMNKAKLMYVARYDALKNILEARLMAVSATHPFYNVSGSDNIISFTSQRYNSQPLVVRGPGAGAEVTAAGIFADIVRLSPNNF
jgi:aspartokinase/homoserine dehydrogenase 1